MSADPILTIWLLVLAHLVADFLLQTGDIVAAKTSTGTRAWRGLAAHGIGVVLCLAPIPVAFGVSGLWVLVGIALSHVAIDRAKVVATRRAEARAVADAQRRHEGRVPAASLGRAWTPMPAAYFAIDQAAHVAVLAGAWAIWLAGQPPTAEWSTTVDSLLGGWDHAAVHHIVLVAVIIASLLIANVRGGALFVATLVRPIEMASGSEAPAAGSPAVALAELRRDAGAEARRGAQPRGWSVSFGPLTGRVVPDAATSPPPDAIVDRGPLPSVAQVGATIGVLERLLIVIFVLAGADAAVGFVVGAKTLARFRLLDDRDFAEYYLLGTLASVAVAILTALIARAALAS